MNNFITILFLIFGVGYLLYLYKKGIYIASMYWLGGFILAFILPNLVKDNYTFGYFLDSSIYFKLNMYYLLVLVLFIVTNYFLSIIPMKSSRRRYLGLDYKSLKRVNLIYIIFSIITIPLVGLRNFSGAASSLNANSSSIIGFLVPLVVFGLTLSSIIKLIYTKTTFQKIITIIQIFYALFFGLRLGFARRLIIYPIIISLCFLVILKQKKPKLSLVIISLFMLLIIILPMMISIRTLGLWEGILNYKEILFGNYQILLSYLQMSLDVTWSYAVAAIVYSTNFHITPLTLLKPISVIIPRSIWPDKPLPLSLVLVKELNLTSDPNQSVPVGVIGEAYTYFGVLGVILSGVLWGFITGYLDKKIKLVKDSREVKNDFSALVLIILSVQIIMGALRGDISTTLIETENVILPFIIILLLARKIK